MCGGSSTCKSVKVDGAGGAEVSGQRRCVNPPLATPSFQRGLDTGIPSSTLPRRRQPRWLLTEAVSQECCQEVCVADCIVYEAYALNEP